MRGNGGWDQSNAEDRHLGISRGSEVWPLGRSQGGNCAGLGVLQCTGRTRWTSLCVSTHPIDQPDTVCPCEVSALDASTENEHPLTDHHLSSGDG